MIRGYADAGRLLKEPKYTAAGIKAAEFVLAKLRTDEGRLMRSYAKGQAKFNAYAEDYAFLIDGLLALHAATGDKRWLTTADELMAKQIELFWDEKQAGFFETSSDHESLLARAKVFSDNVQPSPNSVSLMNLLVLSEKLERPAYRDHAQRLIQSASGSLERSPLYAPQLAVGVAKWLQKK